MIAVIRFRWSLSASKIRIRWVLAANSLQENRSFARPGMNASGVPSRIASFKNSLTTLSGYGT